MEQYFVENNCEYLSSHGEDSGLPFGASVEITKLVHLRMANALAVSDEDCEHVTPYIKRKYGVKVFSKYKFLKMSHYRCTVDYLDDYLNILNIFSDVIDPVKESMLDLVSRLRQRLFQEMPHQVASKLILGTAQLGSEYGIANSLGRPSFSESQTLIRTAINNGVKFLDTARAYGDSEEVIGLSLRDGWLDKVKLITKLDPLKGYSLGGADLEYQALVDSSIFRSCKLLGVNRLDVLMLHRASHISDWGGKIWESLIKLKLSGAIGELGVSVQSPQELLNVLNNNELSYIQMPFNLLDYRWDGAISKILEAKRKRSLNIHIRSTLLQGLLASKISHHWASAHVDNSSDIIDWLEGQVKTVTE